MLSTLPKTVLSWMGTVCSCLSRVAQNQKSTILKGQEFKPSQTEWYYMLRKHLYSLCNHKYECPNIWSDNTVWSCMFGVPLTLSCNFDWFQLIQSLWKNEKSPILYTIQDYQTNNSPLPFSELYFTVTRYVYFIIHLVYVSIIHSAYFFVHNATVIEINDTDGFTLNKHLRIASLQNKGHIRLTSNFSFWSWLNSMTKLQT